ncbi:MAG TPA: beta-N-acetylhexosaminidase [Gemmatimonadaceae bacterium]|nr:beta-N-acetylhexosaminidase [Gemmatimonadaceae bacterium]
MRRFTLLLAIAAWGSLTPLRAQATLHLIPQPREVTPLESIPLAHGVAINAHGAADKLAAKNLETMLRARGIRVVPLGTANAVRITLARADWPAAQYAFKRDTLTFEPVMHDEGYILVAGHGEVVVAGATAAGVFYGVQTLKQMVVGDSSSARIEGAKIRDWPAMRYRGIQDDLSRGPVPTLDFQKKQIRTFAAYKINVYSPYFENTLAYTANPLMAPPGGAMTPSQVKQLVDYAKQYHITIIPEQEAFGHLHHVLEYEAYSDLAETPHGHVLAPGQPGSLELIRQMFGQIDSLFPGPFVHIGADETFELGRGQTAGEVKIQGLGAVYLDFLKRIAITLRPFGKRLLFWGDIAMKDPDLVKTLPKGLIAVAWTYNPQRSFDRYITPYRDAGLETWVAPGVNNWSRVYPDNDMALRNIQGFVRDGQRLGATGVLNTSWDDDGEALFNNTWYGVLFGAAAGWQPGESSIEQFQNSFGQAFLGDTTGRMNDAHRKLIAAQVMLHKAGVGDASDHLFWLDPWSQEGQRVAQKIRPIAHDLRLLAEQALVLAQETRPTIHQQLDALDAFELGARRIDLIGMKFQFADEIVGMYAHAVDTVAVGGSPTPDLGNISGINGRLQDLRDAFSLVRDQYEQAWRRENRPYWLHNVLVRYDIATQRWVERADRVDAARQEWYQSRRLPSAAEVGIPATMPGMNLAAKTTSSAPQ